MTGVGSSISATELDSAELGVGAEFRRIKSSTRTLASAVELESANVRMTLTHRPASHTG